MSRDVHQQFCTALLQHCAPARLITSRERPWASITFSGTRHWVTIVVRPDAADQLATALPETEFDLPGQLVADLCVTERQPATEGVHLSVEALTVLTG